MFGFFYVTCTKSVESSTSKLSDDVGQPKNVWNSWNIHFLGRHKLVFFDQSKKSLSLSILLHSSFYNSGVD